MPTNGRYTVRKRAIDQEEDADPFADLHHVNGSGGPFPVAELPPELLRDAVAAWTAQGHAILFRLTEDGKSMAIHLFADGKKDTSYYTDPTALTSFLTRIRGPERMPEGV